MLSGEEWGLKKGDHIYCYKTLFVYSRHGIYVGDDRVIYLRAPQRKGLNRLLISYTTKCKICGFEKDLDGGIVKACLECFRTGNKIRVCNYDTTFKDWLWTLHHTAFPFPASKPADEVVETATKFLEKNDSFQDYNFFLSNDGHFAVYCKTGKELKLNVLQLASFFHFLSQI